MSEASTTAPTFRQTKNGYDPADVHAHIDELNKRLVDASDNAETERRHAEEAKRAAETARNELRELERRSGLPGYEAIAQRLRGILESADEAAAELRARAESHAYGVKKQAEDRGAEILAEARVEADATVQRGRQEATEAIADAHALKKQAEDRGAEILAEARVEADATVQRGRQEATKAIADAERRVQGLRDDIAQLEQQRDRALEALGSLRDRLTRAAQDLIPAGDERRRQDDNVA